MEKTYDPHLIEQQWYERWERQGHFAPKGEGLAYCIMIPPPNVTGTLHMGHAFQDTLMDALIRYHRMRGYNTLWQAGTDHAGIATQMVVERQLESRNESRHELGREGFLERVWAWKEESGGHITRQLRRMGASLDWSRERFTMDAGLSRAVTEVFVRLFDEGLIYRGKRLVNWDPVLHTAISDLEVVSAEEQGKLWHMRYPLADDAGHLVVATTRPETMLGDTAVAVHPDDERYRHLIGKSVILPLAERRIPIIADEYVDPEFGTGCVKITPAHDFNDYAVGQRHGLPQINIFTVDARVNENGPEAYRGLDRYEARERIVADLQARDLLEHVEDHKLMVPRGDRSGAVVEPFLTDQWFVDLTCETQSDGRPGGHTAITEPAIRAVQDGNIKFIPSNWEKTYYNWLANIEDWCISRQLWWGHRIPAWYDDDSNLYVARSEEEVRAKYGLSDSVALRQDEDVLDTWFSSALWPFSTLGWPDETDELKTFYPTSVLVTGFDIIFFWVARMIMMGMKFMGDVPFHEVYVHGLVRDAEGQKMSKSKGNVLDPIDLIDGIELDDLIGKRVTGLMQPQMAERIRKGTRKQFPEGIPAFGTDALRFTFASLATQGRDIRFDLNRIEGYRNFCNKLWNAARYVLMQTDGKYPESGTALEPSLADRWIVSLMQRVAAEVNEHIQAYRFDLAAKALYEFTWREYCDWYLELSKPVLSSVASSEAQRAGTRHTLIQVLDALLRMLHPLMPYITEEIWHQLDPAERGEDSSIQLQSYPQAEPDQIDAEAIAEAEWTKTFVMGVRRIRSEMDIAPGKPLPLLVQSWSEDDRRRYERNETYIQFLAKPQSVDWLEPGSEAPESATALVGEMKILIPLSGLIDKEAEQARLEKEIAKLALNLEKGEAKLSNTNFVERAPSDVVENERARVAELRTALAQLEAELTKIKAL